MVIIELVTSCTDEMAAEQNKCVWTWFLVINELPQVVHKTGEKLSVCGVFVLTWLSQVVRKA